MAIGKAFDQSDQALVSVRQVAGLLGVSQRHVWAMAAHGQMPMPVRLGRSVRWNRAELLSWIKAGCPARDRWEAIQGAGR